MIVKQSISKCLVVLSMAFLGGCDFVLGPPPEPPPFTKQEIKGIEKCQGSINQAGGNFLAKGLKMFEQCLAKGLKAQLSYESGLSNEAKLQQDLQKAREFCGKKYVKIGEASDKMVGDIWKTCGPVETAVFGESDPLQFQALWTTGEFGAPLTSIAELAGFLCAAKAFAADTLVGLQFPRKCYILEALGPEFGANDGEFCWPLIPLNPLCEAFTETLSSSLIR